MKKLIIIVLLGFIPICYTFTQESHFAVHLSNPLGLFQKVGVKLEYRTGRVGVLLTGTKHFGNLPKYSGERGGGELRLYSKNKAQKQHELFQYIKINAGHIDYYPGSGEGFTRFNEIPESSYYSIAAGLGKHFNFNHFFIDINAGLKYSNPEVKQDAAFYITGPGSILDVQLNVGYQF